MLTPASLLPPDEAERLATLQHYDFPAAAPDNVFRDLVAFCASLFNLSHAFLALVEAQQVSFPVVHGVLAVAPIPRSEALCSSAILYPRATAYENLVMAPQTGADAPAIRAVLAAGGGFYAAAPLVMPDGRRIGVLCLVGAQPRLFGAAEQEALEDLAALASIAIAVHHLCQATPELGPSQWKAVRHHLHHDLQALGTQLGSLQAEHGTPVPVPAAVLHPVRSRLQALRVVLTAA